MQAKPGITIVIPVYNAADKLRLCLASVLCHTALAPDCRLLLLDDASHDPAIAQILAASQADFVQIEHNVKNLGYTRSINKGIDLCAGRDVLLLNSDTIVTPRWLEKLAAHAAQPNAGTVTPLSNNAGAFSAPSPGPNSLPAGLEIDAAAAILEACASKPFFDAPTGNGFCMLIRRALIDAIGMFDDINFPRGYAEENDFCMRAYHAGFRNLVALDTYIWHWGHGSFGPERARLLEDGLDRMRALYPDYFSLIREFDLNLPLRRTRIAFARALGHDDALPQTRRWLSAPRQFVAVFRDRLRQKGLRHCLKKSAQAMAQILRSGNAGQSLGKLTAMYASIEPPAVLRAESIQASRDRVLSLLPEGAPLVCMIDHNYDGGAYFYSRRRMREIVNAGGAVLNVSPPFNARPYLYATLHTPKGRLCLRPPDFDDILAARWLPLSSIFINELVTWDNGARDRPGAVGALLAALAACASQRGIGMEMATHEYFCVCPSYNLLDRSGYYCGLPTLDTCAKCGGGGFFRRQTDGMAQWRAMFAAFLPKLASILCFSRAAADIILRIYPEVKNIVSVRPHAPLAQWPEPYALPPPGPIRAAVLVNGLSEIKGRAIVLELARLLAPDERLIMLGNCDNFAPGAENVIFHGAYQRERLPEIFALYGVNAALVPSIWPETFCYVAQECAQLGLPLVCFDLGAQGERARAYAKGRIAPEMTARGALQTLREANRDR